MQYIRRIYYIHSWFQIQMDVDNTIKKLSQNEKKVLLALQLLNGTGSPKDILNSVQLNARQFFVPVNDREKGAVPRFPQLPFRFSAGFISPKKGAFLPGQDNAKIYKDELGFSNRDIQQLLDSNII